MRHTLIALCSAVGPEPVRFHREEIETTSKGLLMAGLLLLELSGQPVQTLVQALAGRGTCGLQNM